MGLDLARGRRMVGFSRGQLGKLVRGERINMAKLFAKTFVVILVALASSTMHSYSATIDVLSQSFYISATAWIPGYPSPYNIGLPIFSSGPSSVRLTDTYPSLDSFGYVNTYVTGGSAGPSTIIAAVAIDRFVFGNAIAQITFRPSESGLLDVGIAGQNSGGSAFWSMSLVDLTTGTTLLTSHKSGDTWVIQERFLNVDSSDVYMLTDRAGGDTADEASVVTTLSLISVPDICSTFLILAMGLVGLVGLNWHFRHSAL
jgi:hypothetical protein